MRTAIAPDAAVKYVVRLLKILMVVCVLHAAVVVTFAQPSTLITPTNTTWRYFTNGTDPGAEWALPGFDDSSWPQGRGLFGNDGAVYVPLGFNTPIPGPGQGGPLTVYFRTHFTWNGPRFGVVLAGTNFVDDGCVVYLNGIEITRFNMPPGPPAFDTQAPVANPGGYPNLTGGEPVLVQMAISLDNLTNGNPNPLAIGDNVLAVEVHNQGSGSSDVVFGMSLLVVPDFPCTSDNIQPTNRTVVEGRSTTFVVATTCFPTPAFQWYRNIGWGEGLIPGATSTNYTLTNAMDVVDEGVYYCRMTSVSGTMDSRQATLTILPDLEAPRFLYASVVGPGLNTFRLHTDEQLCGDGRPVPDGCGGDFRFQFNWQIVQSDDWSGELGVVTNRMINPTTYEFTTSLPRDPTKRYRISVLERFGEISDRYGNRVPPGTFAETGIALTFQQNDANGYTGTQDAEIHSNATADTVQGTAATVTVDNDDAGIAQGLLRFDNIFGAGPTQILPGSQIVSATLTLNQVDPGSAANFHRMLVTWDQTTVTWNSMVNGIANDDVEAVAASDALSTAEPFANGPMLIDVTASLRAWSMGQENYGWAIRSTGTAGWDWNTSESGVSTAPILSVEYFYFDECFPATFVTQPPASVVLREFQTFTLSAVVSNVSGVFQWSRNGVDIPGATGPSYTIHNATAADSGTYRLRISCPPAVTIAISSPSVVIVGDNFPPELIAAAAQSDGVTVALRFSESLNEASAQNPTNYVFDPSLAVLGAVLSNSTVTLTTAPREHSMSHTLRISNIRDNTVAATLIFPNPTIVNLTSARVIVPWTADGWHYNTNNLDATPDWKNPGFTPGPDWGTGRALFGVESSGVVLALAPASIATPLTPNGVAAESERLVTTYFRKTIDLPALPAGARYVICHYADDGFIAYLDVAEIHRFAMPAGAVTFTTRSTGIPTGEATYRSFSFNATPGMHTLAVELHQADITSSDVLFGMEVRMVGGPSPALSIARSSFGDVNLTWNADGNWRLRNAVTLSGPYLDVAIPIGSRLGTYTLPATSVTNRSFWLLDYTGRP